MALFTMFDVSFISTMNVDWPRARSSFAPTRVKMRSTSPISALSAGTKLPICAINTISATWRMYVDFPAMFGPVTIATRKFSPSSAVSLGTNFSSTKF